MASSLLIQTIDLLNFGSGAQIEVRVEDGRVKLMFYMSGQSPQMFYFSAEQAKRIGDAMMTGAARLSIKL